MATIEQEVADDHARQAAFLWLLRDHAVRDVAYDLAALGELDARLEANLDGLRLAGDDGFSACRALLEEPEGGEVFAAAVLAVERWDLRGVAHVLDVGGEAPDLARGMVSALGYLPFERVERLLPGLLAPGLPAPLLWLGIAACGAHRVEPGAALGFALAANEPLVRARALRAVGELGLTRHQHEVRDALTAEDPVCRFWAAWTGALFGDDAAARALWDFAVAPGPFAERAACVAMRRLDPRTGADWIRALAGTGGEPRVPIRAAGALGDPALVPWLIERAGDPGAARLAGFAITRITGVDLRAAKLTAPPPQGHRSAPSDDPADEDVSMDPDESLPFPDPERVGTFWRRHGGGLRRGVRHLLGKPIAPEHLERVLRSGDQDARAGAALELAIAQRGHPVFEVRAFASAQRARLGR